MNLVVVDAFTLYWAMGEERSLETLAQRSGVPLVLLCEHFARERWDLRLAHLGRELTFNEELDAKGLRRRLRLLVEFMKGKSADGLLRFGDTALIRISRIVSGSRVVLAWNAPKRRAARRLGQRTKR